jgi:prevent-host-death family protein
LADLAVVVAALEVGADTVVDVGIVTLRIQTIDLAPTRMARRVAAISIVNYQKTHALAKAIVYGFQPIRQPTKNGGDRLPAGAASDLERSLERNDMAALTEQNLARTVTSKEALRHWKEVTDKALREPIVITAHGRPRHVLLAYEDYERLREQGRQVHLTSELPADLASAILEDLDNLRAPSGAVEDSDTIIG